VVTELFNSGGRTNRMKSIVDFRNFRKVPKIKILLVYIKVRCTFYVIRYTNCCMLMEK